MFVNRIVVGPCKCSRLKQLIGNSRVLEKTHKFDKFLNLVHA